MQNKLVENWLINAGELTFTTPFVQLLIAEGYTVLHVSRGNHVEQGKDIIAKNPKGEVVCYQLKSGNLTGKKWYEIKSQVDELTELPPVLSALPEITEWKCYLVTNGTVPNAVERNIADYKTQRIKKGFMPVEIIAQEELVDRFNKGFGNFLPAEPEDIRFFFEMFCQHGDEMIDRKVFKEFFEDFFNKRNTAPKQKKIEAINASLVLASYLLSTRYVAGNNIEIIIAWTLLATTILYFANKWGLKEGEYSHPIDLVHDEIDTLSQVLFDDVANNTRNFTDSTYGLLAEAFITYRLRAFDLLGYITAHLTSEHLRANDTPQGNIEALKKLADLAPRKIYVGEFQFPLILGLMKTAQIAGQADKILTEVRGLVRELLKTMIDDKVGLPSPYYDIYESVNIIFNFTRDPEPPETFDRRSYIMWSLILILAYLGDREFLNNNWPDICEVSMQEYVPDKIEDLLLWKSDEGVLRDSYITHTQSWSELQELAKKASLIEYPEVLKNQPWLVPYFLLAMPHRVNPQTVLNYMFELKPKGK